MSPGPVPEGRPISWEAVLIKPWSWVWGPWAIPEIIIGGELALPWK